VSHDLARLLLLQDGVVTRSQALRFMTAKALYHRVESGRWRLVHRGVYLTHNGPVTGSQRDWIAVLATGRGHALLAGLSALSRFGFRGYADRAVHVLLPARYRDTDPPRGVTVHRTGWLPGAEVHGRGRPPSTMPARSLVDAAQWAPNEDRARAIVAAAGYQQRLVTGDEVTRVLDGMRVVRRRALIRATAVDAAGGSHSVSEVEFLNLCRSAGLPVPSRQTVRLDASGARRYRDAYFEPFGVHVEIDGGQHMEVSAWWADMKRQNDMWIQGDRVLRFPAWTLRARPADVAAQLRAALLAAGWTGRT
jgi:hypothetical protein